MDIMTDMSTGELLFAIGVTCFLLGVSSFVLYMLISWYGMPW